MVNVWPLSSLVNTNVTFGYGFPFTSYTIPFSELSNCARATGPSQAATGPTNTVSSTAIQIYFLLLMFAPSPQIRHSARDAAGPTEAALLWRNSHAIGDRVGFASLVKRPQAQPATVARPASGVPKLITRPGKAQRRSELNSAPNDFAFAHADHGRDDLDLRFGT